MRLFILFVAFFIIAFTSISAQKDTSLEQNFIYEIETKDGNKVIGEVTDMNDETITIDVKSMGLVNINKSEIIAFKKRDLLLELDEDGIAIDYHNSTYNVISPTAYTLKKGQAYYQNIYLFFNSVTFGLSDRFQLTGGLEVSSILFAQEFPLIYIAPKYNIPIERNKVNLSIGASIITIPYTDQFSIVGLTNTFLTVGPRNNNITIGTGLGFSLDDGFSGEVIPLFLSGMTRVARKISLISDNSLFLIDGDIEGILSAGLRYHFNDYGSSFNFALYRPTADIGIIALPFASVTIAFGKK